MKWFSFPFADTLKKTPGSLGVFLYISTIAFACAISTSFFVLDVGDAFLFIAMATGPVFFLGVLYRVDNTFGLAAVHICIAIAIHPAVVFREPAVFSDQMQTEMFAKINSYSTENEWILKNNLAESLAKSLRIEANNRMRRNSPVLFWAFPPSVVLALWGMLLFWIVPAPRKDEFVQP